MASSKKKPGRKARNHKTTKSVSKNKMVVATPAAPQSTDSPKTQKGAVASKPKKQKLPKPIWPKLTSVIGITKVAARLLIRNWKLYGGIALVYAVLTLVLVQGIAGISDVTGLKTQITQLFHGHISGLTSSLGIFFVLLGSSNSNSSPDGGGYQLLIVLMVSLAAIWALRQSAGATSVRIRDAFYRGMYPLVPFLLVLLVVGLQLIPLLVGSSIYNIVVVNGIAVHWYEQLFWLVIFIVLAAWSLYMLSASLIALYVAALPDMTPLKALRTARYLVRGRRWTVVRKILFLPLLLVIVASVIMTPVILLVTFLTPWIFLLLTMCVVVVVHAYMYSLYRELINE